jgi:trk system potassium uptake protein
VVITEKRSILDGRFPWINVSLPVKTNSIMRGIKRLFIRKYFNIKKIVSRFQMSDEDMDSIDDLLRAVYRFSIPVLTILTFAYLIFDVGYNDFYEKKPWFYNLWSITYWVTALLFIIRAMFTFKELAKWRPRLFNFGVIGLILFLQYLPRAILTLNPESSSFLLHKLALFIATAILVFIESSQTVRLLYRKAVNPALVFVTSFFMLMVIGTFLLMLPNATTHGISAIDAWFTSASAVCVTGLTVVDTSVAFTTFGKVVIIALVQIGGLGIMTFAGILGYLAAGSLSFTNQLALKDMVSSNRLGNVMNFVGRVIVVTLSFEALGAVLIYFSIPQDLFHYTYEKLFFSLFHSVSAFCNAGFSTLSYGLYDPLLRFNYSFQIVIIFLIVFGGLGFPILFNVAAYIKTRTKNIFNRLLKVPEKEYYAHIIHTSSRIALTTTIFLLVFGFIAYLILERNATLLDHKTVTGKIVTSLFGSVTPRTAGFNTVDMTKLTFPTVMIYLLLMYIGASPGSTGGGIKTTVAGVAFLNMKSIILGKSRTEVYRTQISEGSINRAFAIMILSLLIIGLSILLVSFNDSEKGLFKIAFEVFSAFSTVGLTLGITADMSPFSKIVLSLVMLAGRVGTITLLVAFISPAKETYFRYPTEDVLL